MRRPLTTIAGIVLLCALGGCARVDGLPRQSGMAERCARFMTEAYPGGDIKITASGAAPTSLTTIVAKVEGVREDLPPHAPGPGRLAVECRFDSGVLTGFRWTKGPM